MQEVEVPLAEVEVEDRNWLYHEISVRGPSPV